MNRDDFDAALHAAAPGAEWFVCGRGAPRRYLARRCDAWCLVCVPGADGLDRVTIEDDDGLVESSRRRPGETVADCIRRVLGRLEGHYG